MCKIKPTSCNAHHTQTIYCTHTHTYKTINKFWQQPVSLYKNTSESGSKLSEYGVQRCSDGSVSVSDSVLVKVSGADEDNEKEVLVSWSLQVRNCNE